MLLGGRSHSAYGLWREHSRIFGATWVVDLRRVADAVTRLERHGLVRAGAMPVSRATSGTRRACSATPAGRQRQVEWLRAVPGDAGIEEIRVRGLLAVTSGDRRLLDAFLASGFAFVERRMNDGVGDGADFAERASVAFGREVAPAVARWLDVLAREAPKAAKGSKAANG